MTSRLVTVELSVDRGGREATVRTLIYQTWARPDKHQIRAAYPSVVDHQAGLYFRDHYLTQTTSSFTGPSGLQASLLKY